MDVETSEVESGIRINVFCDREVAVVVYSGDEERIYLPEGSGSDSTYYVENSSGLVQTDQGYSVVHRGRIDDLTVIG